MLIGLAMIIEWLNNKYVNFSQAINNEITISFIKTWCTIGHLHPGVVMILQIIVLGGV